MSAIEIKIDNEKKYGLKEILELSNTTEECGVTRKNYTINPAYGTGNLVTCSFDGLVVRQLNIKLNHNLNFNGLQEVNALVFSAMLDGEKTISIPDSSVEIVQESYEGYIAYLDTVKGTMSYSKDRIVKEIVVKMSANFIEKHRLDTLFPIHDEYAISQLKKNFIHQLDSKTQDIINELICDSRTGLLKRLFLESKALELLSLQIGKDHRNEVKNSTATKKVYLAKDIITKNLDTQFSIFELSKKVYLNEFLLKKEFKRIFNITIFEFALQERMKKAKHLLTNTDTPIYEIAEFVGYKNPTHFSAAFKKIEQMTPKQFRKRIQ
ncbi:helix-turn-helix domain-containing protein [Tenacibaculum amylolyticum]|uniref:helix-turn-helix domain-containing protein n=1 Tax=Tenacibaculum amylolyticum TaxID=104269 RepID=UPI003893CFFB